MSKNAKSSSAGSADANKTVITDTNGIVDQTFLNSARTWTAVQTLTADNLQVTTDADSANDAIRLSLLQEYVYNNEYSLTSGEAFSVGNALYVKASDGRLYKTAGTSDESTYSFVGIALEAASASGQVKKYARPGGIVTGLTSLTAGSYYFVSDTAGAIATTPGTRYAKVGQALSTTVLRVTEPKFIRYGSQVVDSVAAFSQTTGFYPMYVSCRAVGGTQGTSEGDDRNICVFVSATSGAGIVGSNATAYFVREVTGTVINAGSITSKTQGGFTLNNTTNNSGAPSTIYWTAWSE